MPVKPKDVDEGIIRGLYKLRSAPKGDGPVVRLIGSGPIMLQVLDAVEKLEQFGVRSEIWSATSYGELRRDGLECERWNRLNPDKEEKQSWVEKMFSSSSESIIAVSDNMAAVPDMVRQWMPDDYTVLGTDGFGRSDTRESLRRFFEIDGKAITLATLSRLVRKGDIESSVYNKAVKKFKVESERQDIAEL
jgi:pyruvate dehydrogenase E1 component